MATLKIGYYKLHLLPRVRAQGADILSELNGLLDYITAKDELHRKMELDTKIFYFLETRHSNGLLLFEHNRYNYRPKLRNKDTFIERESPKEAAEGDEVKVCAAVKRAQDNEMLVLLEEKRGGMGIGEFVKYLNHFMKKWVEEGHANFHFGYTPVLEPTFEEKLNDSRVKAFELDALQVSVKRRIVNASGYLRFSERDSIHNNVKIKVVAEKKWTVREGLKELLTRRGNEKVEVTSITILDSHGHQRKLNITRLKMVKYFRDVPEDSNTGEVRPSEAQERIQRVMDEIDG